MTLIISDLEIKLVIYLINNILKLKTIILY